MTTPTQMLLSIEHAIAAISYPAQPAGLYKPIEYTMQAGGKRLRPTLLLATVDSLGGDMDKAMPQALGIEFFHNFTLLHDDVMDNADVRRGRPTVHRRWNANTAILSGDAMLTMAAQFMGDCRDDVRGEVLEVFNRTAMEIYEGQQYDMDFEDRNDVTVAEYTEMIRLKTSVLLACACRIGAILAGATKGVADSFYEFGEALGLAFQLQDDYLDTFGDAAVFGKAVGGDILNAKKTWLWISACAEDKSGVMRAALDGLYTGQDKIAKVTEVYRSLGLDRRIVDLISVYSNQALAALRRTGLEDDKLVFFVDLTRSLQSRNK